MLFTRLHFPHKSPNEPASLNTNKCTLCNGPCYSLNISHQHSLAFTKLLYRDMCIHIPARIIQLKTWQTNKYQHIVAQFGRICSHILIYRIILVSGTHLTITTS